MSETSVEAAKAHWPSPSRRKVGVRLSGNGPRAPRGLPYLLLAPAGLFIAVFSFFPFLWAIGLSVQPPLQASEGSITGFTLDNFKDVLTDPTTRHSVWVTLLYALLSSVLCIAVSLATALALKTVRRGGSAYQTFLLIPLTVPAPVVIILWRALFEPSSGAVNGILGALGISPQGFYESPNQAMLVLVAMAVWTSMGFWTLVFLSGLNSISSEIFEAADLDGAGPFRRLFRVTVPLLRRSLLLAGVVLMSAGLIVFIPAQLLTNGGPGDATNFLMYAAAEDVLRYGQPGSANATVVIILALIGIIAAVQFRLIRSDDA
jgi:multiple sugar transport system permease protein